MRIALMARECLKATRDLAVAHLPRQHQGASAPPVVPTMLNSTRWKNVPKLRRFA
ncbi:MAG: hypothetical protein ABSG12_12590 [Steroidobacteraceae bacterium]|jgi:hypothetical protein